MDNINLLLGSNIDESLLKAEKRLKNKICTADQISYWEYIPTGCPNLDSILKGGIPINGIVELYGSSGVGKTQFCLHVALQIQLPRQLGGREREVVYICTEDVFPSKRLNQLANIWNNKYNLQINFEDNIYLKHLADSVQFINCLTQELPKLMLEKNIGIIIIDSIAGLFRSENENPNYITRSKDFRTIEKALHKLQVKFNCATLLTNQIVDDIITGIQEPCLGLAWSNNVINRFSLTKTSSGLRTFDIIFSPNIPSNSTEISIELQGLISVT